MSDCGAQCGKHTHTWEETFGDPVILEGSQEKEPTREIKRSVQRHNSKTREENC